MAGGDLYTMRGHNVEHKQRLSTWLNVENGKGELLMACLRVQSTKTLKDIPVAVRETKHEMRDKVARVEGEMGVKADDEFSVAFADWRLQHDTSTFTRVKVDGKEAGNIKMDRDSAPLSSEPNYDREWKISAYENGEPFSFGPTAQGQVIVELHSVRAETGEDPSVVYRSIFRDATHPKIQFLFPPSRPYATFTFNYHKPEDLPRHADVLESEHSQSDDDVKKEKQKRKLRPNRKRAIVENFTSDEDHEDLSEKKKDKGKGTGTAKKKRESKSPSFEPEETPAEDADGEMEEGDIREETPVRVDKGKGKGKARKEAEGEEEQQPETDEAPKRLKRGKDQKKAVTFDSDADEEDEDNVTPTKVAAKKKSKAKVAVKAPAVKATQRGGKSRGKGRRLSKATVNSEDEDNDSGLGPVPEPMSEDEV